MKPSLLEAYEEECQTFQLKRTGRCAICGGYFAAEEKTNACLETGIPGFEEIGDPQRMMEWHVECTPTWFEAFDE